MSHEQVEQFDESSIFGAPLSASLLHGSCRRQRNVPSWILSIVMILAMTASQFITQKQIMAKNMSEEAMASPFMRQQKMMLYILPIVFGVGGINFPIGVLIYWTTTNLWTMAQQFFVIRRMPTPGSPAAKALAERRAAKGLPALPLTGAKKADAEAAAAAALSPWSPRASASSHNVRTGRGSNVRREHRTSVSAEVIEDQDEPRQEVRGSESHR